MSEGTLGEMFAAIMDHNEEEMQHAAKRLAVEEVAYHRNGICGEPFYAVTFRDNGQRFVAAVFGEASDQCPRVAVFDRDLLAAGNITFGENSWRGDQYADALWTAIEAANEAL